MIDEVFAEEAAAVAVDTQLAKRLLRQVRRGSPQAVCTWLVAVAARMHLKAGHGVEAIARGS